MIGNIERKSLSTRSIFGPRSAQRPYAAGGPATAGKVELVKQLGIKLIALPPGEFILQGVGGIGFKGCALAETEFTNGQFRRLAALKPDELSQIITDPEAHLARSLSAVDSDHRDEAEDCPLVYVNQMEADGIARLSGMRLPTVIEWIRAAAYTDGRAYPFGNKFDPDKATYFRAKADGVRSVYAHRNGASPEGILDLAGNVIEWTDTWYGEINLTDPKNPRLPETNQYGTLYKTSCSAPWCGHRLGELRSDSRDAYDPAKSSGCIGFRLAGEYPGPLFWDI